MHDDMQYDSIQGQSQGHQPWNVGNPSIFKSCLLRHLHREVATDQFFLIYGTKSKFNRARFLIYVLVCVTWLWTWQKRWLRRVRQSRKGLIFIFYYYWRILVLVFEMWCKEAATMSLGVDQDSMRLVGDFKSLEDRCFEFSLNCSFGEKPWPLIMLAASSRKCNIWSGIRPSIRLFVRLYVPSTYFIVTH